MTQVVQDNILPLDLGAVIPAIINEAPYGEVELPQSLHEQIVYRKYQSQDPHITDIIYGPTWDEQVTALEQIGLNEDDGCIISVRGTQVGEVGVTRDGEVLGIEQVEMREEANPNIRIPRFSQYAFRIAKIEKTNGPQLRENLQRTAEQQRLGAEEDLVRSIQKAFQQAGDPSAPAATNPMDVVEQLKGMDPLQRNALIEMVDAETEHEQQQIEDMQAAAKAKKK